MAEPAKTSRSLRSRDSWVEKKRQTQQSHTLPRSVASGKVGKDASEVESRGRFRAKLTDTLKLKLIAQPPRNANHKKTSVKPAPVKPAPVKPAAKPVMKKPPPKPAAPVTPVKTDTAPPPPVPPPAVGIVNGFNVVNNHHMPKAYLLYVSNLPVDITRQQLEDHFRKTGGVKNIRIPKEKGTDKGRGYAYVELKDRISHGIGLRLHQTKLAGGRRINVEFTQVGGKQKEKLKRRIRALTKSNPKSTEKT